MYPRCRRNLRNRQGTGARYPCLAEQAYRDYRRAAHGQVSRKLICSYLGVLTKWRRLNSIVKENDDGSGRLNSVQVDVTATINTLKEFTEAIVKQYPEVRIFRNKLLWTSIMMYGLPNAAGRGHVLERYSADHGFHETRDDRP